MCEPWRASPIRRPLQSHGKFETAPGGGLPILPRLPTWELRKVAGAESGDASVIVTLAELSALAQVVVVDLVLAGDNAVVVGLVAAGLPRHQRAKVIFTGIAAAPVLRAGFAIITTQLLQIIGLTLAGGLLLLWVTWKLWREIKAQKAHAKAKAAAGL